MLNDKKILYSGMQATGTLTLGNYLGALKNWVDLNEEYECLYGVMDLHSLTVRQVPADFRKNARSFLTSTCICLSKRYACFKYSFAVICYLR